MSIFVIVLAVGLVVLWYRARAVLIAGGTLFVGVWLAAHAQSARSAAAVIVFVGIVAFAFWLCSDSAPTRRRAMR